MKSYKVQFVNFELGSIAVFGEVKGFSGKSYLKTRKRNGRHESELISLERYEEIIRDVAHAWHLPMRKWVPLFVEVDDGAAAAPVSTNVEAAGSKPVAAGELFAEPVGELAPEPETDGGEVVDNGGLDGMPFFELRKLANTKRREKNLNIKTEKLKRTELIEFLKAA